MSKNAFQIVICTQQGSTYTEGFRELAETLLYGLRALGYEANIHHNSFSTTARNIILGAHFLNTTFTPQQLEQLPDDTIIYNTEQMDPNSLAVKSELLYFIQRYETWDYSLRNIERMGRIGITSRLKFVPVGYVPELTRIPKDSTEDIDILFYGSLGERRKVILDTLLQAGAKVHFAFNVYGAERDALIRRAKIVLNIHFYNSAIFESVRVSYLLANQKAVVAECGPNTDMDEGLREGVELANYDGLVAACLGLLRDESRRHELAQRGFACIRRRPEQVLLQQALDLPARSLAKTEVSGSSQTTLPSVVNMGSGKNWRADCLNLDCNATWNPDLILDLNHPLPFGTFLPSDRFGMIPLAENQMDALIAMDVLEHIDNLIVLMTSALKWLKPGGQFIIQVPYDLSLGAWQDPTHVRAFNENSWLYYTEWFWYLGWNEARFDQLENTFLLSEYGKVLQGQGKSMAELLCQPRAVDAMKVVLRKRLLNQQERESAQKFHDRSG